MRRATALALAFFAHTTSLAAPAYATHGDETLATLIADALAENRAIRSAEWQERAAREGIAAATALPDPALQLTGFPRGPQTRVGPQIAGIAVTQRVPWFGKLADEGEAVASQAEVRRALAGVVRADVVQQVKLAYFEAAYLARAIRIAREEEELLRHYESLARAQYAQGAGLQRDVVRIQAEITRVQGRLREFEGLRAGVEALLNALRHQPTHRSLPRIELGARPVADVDPDALRITARNFAPEVKVAEVHMALKAASARIAQSRHLPEIVVGAGWGVVGDRNDAPGMANPPPGNGEDTFHVSAGVTIPIRRAKYDAGIRQADAAFASAKDSHRNALANVDAAVRSIASRLVALDGRIALAEGTLLPQAETALSSTEDAYATGAVGVLDLLDGEEMLLGVRHDLARLHADYMKALADMERATGVPFPVQRESAPGGTLGKAECAPSEGPLLSRSRLPDQDGARTSTGPWSEGNLPSLKPEQDGPLEGRHSAFPSADRRFSSLTVSVPGGTLGRAECPPSKGPLLNCSRLPDRDGARVSTGLRREGVSPSLRAARRVLGRATFDKGKAPLTARQGGRDALPPEARPYAGHQHRLGSAAVGVGT